jgi:quercetin dioxygenase-like cupin family protein
MFLLAGGLAGCLTAREEAVQFRMPQNHVFDPVEVSGEMAEGPLALVNRAQGQSVCVLRLPMEDRLGKLYHAETDLTVVVVGGTAAVEVEEARYVAEKGDTIVLPRMTAYSIIPNDPEQPFVGLCVFSPYYAPNDIVPVE